MNPPGKDPTVYLSTYSYHVQKGIEALEQSRALDPFARARALLEQQRVYIRQLVAIRDQATRLLEALELTPHEQPRIFEEV